jgi:hypothetical protein
MLWSLYRDRKVVKARRIDSDNVDYVIQRIRDDYISGTSCTVVLVGDATGVSPTAFKTCAVVPPNLSTDRNCTFLMTWPPLTNAVPCNCRVIYMATRKIVDLWRAGQNKTANTYVIEIPL